MSRTKNSKIKRIYLDYAAAAPMDKRVKKGDGAVFGRKISAIRTLYIRKGWRPESAVETAREEAAKVLGARAKEIIFTAGGTESDNLAILGRVYAMTGGDWKVDLFKD